MIRRVLVLVLAFLFASHAGAAGPAKHVVVVVCDGLRPDQVRADTMPTLYKLAQGGVFFQNHHAVFVSATVVNGTAMATGCYPAKDGTVANGEYRPELNPRELVSTADPRVAGQLPVPTLAQILHEHGRQTAIVGSKSVALVHDAHPEAPNLTIFEGHGLPTALVQPLLQTLGPAPVIGTGRDDWSTRALLGPVWDRGLPDFSLLWLSEPDLTQHATSPGSAASRKAMANSDRNLALLLAELDAKHLRGTTDVLVVSDHGFSTITAAVNVAAALQRAGFNTTRQFTADPKPDDILVATNGGSTMLYVIGHRPALVQRIVEFLQQQDFSGVIFTHDRRLGTFPLSEVHLDTAHAPDVVLAMHWGDEKNTNGVPGTLTVDGTFYRPGGGAHASLSRYDLRPTLVAAGPDFRHGMIDELPSGNADLAPTVLTLLGLPVPGNMDGRPLYEALAAVKITSLPPVEATMLHTTADLPAGVWRQYLGVTRFGNAVYFDEGNGAFQPRAAATAPAK